MMCGNGQTGTGTEGANYDWQSEQKSDNESQEIFGTKTEWFIDWLTGWLAVGPLLRDLELHFELHLD